MVAGLGSATSAEAKEPCSAKPVPRTGVGRGIHPSLRRHTLPALPWPPLIKAAAARAPAPGEDRAAGQARLQRAGWHDHFCMPVCSLLYAVVVASL